MIKGTHLDRTTGSSHSTPQTFCAISFLFPFLSESVLFLPQHSAYDGEATEDRPLLTDDCKFGKPCLGLNLNESMNPPRQLFVPNSILNFRLQP